ncbi:MAG: hypothetical protein IIZ83_06710 [Oscillospiraceae bacterium]|nr:hypothetical protein [Oscillospiraceae bacterium]
MNDTNKFVDGCFYLGATENEDGIKPMILVTGRFDEGLHNEIRFKTNLKHRRDEMHRPIYIDYDGNEFVMAYGIMFSATGTDEDSRKEQT